MLILSLLRMFALSKQKGEERKKMISAKLLVEIGSRSTKMRLRRHFSSPQKGKIKVEKADL